MEHLSPAVFCVGQNYQIMSPAPTPSLFSVTIGNKTFYDEFNGLYRSSVPVHKVTVPRRLLDKAKKYTVTETPMLDRKPYFPVTGETVTTTYRFFPLPERTYKAFFISDAHGNSTQTVSAARAYGEIDLLILGGDVADHSGNAEGLMTVYRISDALTHGTKPIVCIRGNHTLRGALAESLDDYIPTDNGKTYYTFSLGSLWGVVLDCGEDKVDGHAEYGGTVCCHSFRERETAFLRQVCEERPYKALGITTRLVLCHVPFSHIQKPPFDIEQDTYRRWCTMLKKHVKPQLMINGHLHRVLYSPVGGEMDDVGQPCPVVIGSVPGESFIGTGLSVSDGNIKISFVREDGQVIEEHNV